ncbi:MULTISPECIES: BMP family ABC transporter substrate-binding protein [unclassified Fibrobacter]|uniref:BMP family ABC transporter substrate-binding protein n=1 Tax=unclassified Fibrobacter TaxID=2634177 RepID=UPI000D6BE0F8|nr:MULTISPECIES: BMP family ABC transporter substrate-binding protein [unclassified Fibrobacter]PWJ70051.1 nucleoside-binding protein [Fibrobacter sp. UWR4]PZW73399.1 nucleoside-binding protein [Fibrobacter sp. UWR1]
MKQFALIAIAIILAIVIGIFYIQVNKRETNVTLEKTRVAFIMNGTRNDHSWGESHVEAMEKVAKSLNLEVLYNENTPFGNEAEGIMEDMIAKGAKVVICNSFGHGEWELKVAARHPEIKFFHATGVLSSNNLSTYFGRIYQMRYLSGMVAGMMTKTNEIGYVAAFGISEVNRGINAFTLGVQKVNPEAKVYVSWTKSWNSDSLAAVATNKLLDNHNVDVLTAHTDALTPFDIAEEKGVWIIGYNLDNSARYPKRFLTAPIWRWEHFYEPRLLEVLQNKFMGRQYWLGAESGMIGLAPMTAAVPEDVKSIVKAEMQKISDGVFDVFYGPVYDIDGNIRVEAGESMTDEDMLSHFDWYVKGVVNE